MINVFKNTNTFKENLIDRTEKLYAIPFSKSSNYQKYIALGTLVSEYISPYWIKTNEKSFNLRKVYYFSMEFLMGRMITNNIINLGLHELVNQAFNELGLDLNEIEHYEIDAGLGNGGLGRLAACFMDSVATLGLPVNGNCIRYRYGFFEQGIENGYQIEKPDRWLKDIHVWEKRRDEEAVLIPFYGDIEINYINEKISVKHINQEYVKAVPYDVPIVGANNEVINTLRLWSAEPAPIFPKNKDPFETHKKIREISSMLYPNDSDYEGKILRLKQQYMFSSAGIQSAIINYKKTNKPITDVDKYLCFHINDTHPSLIIPELMRIFLDEENLLWDQAWDIVKNCCAYTNHTILSEALEKWPIDLFRTLLPRIYTIIEEINRRFVIELDQKGFSDRINTMAILYNGVIRMANLAIIGSYSVNGVAKLHTKILQTKEMKDFNEFYPKKFNNKTNGITHRRWCYHINPELVNILNKKIGKSWVKNPNDFIDLKKYAQDEDLQNEFYLMKLARKKVLRDKIKETQGIDIDINSIFDIQVKRLHEYKRQLLNALHIMHLYNELKENIEFRNNYYPHTFIFGAKAAPSYFFAKKVIKLINTISEKVNNDEETNKYLKVVFVINYNVSYAEIIVPACDISEQISLAGKEASGTGNMKFMMNGAITLGTLDGANVEIKELVGDENITIFGMTSDEVNNITNYNPHTYYESDYRIKRVIDQLTNGFFPNVDINEFQVIKDNILYQDSYYILRDFASYVNAHNVLNELYKDRKKWYKSSIINVSSAGFFSTDRTMEEYNKDIWHLEKIK